MKPYYQDSHVTIYHKDCRDMSEVEDGSVDFGITSPPYNVGIKYLGDFDDSRPLSDFQVWTREWLEEVFRVTTEPGRFYIFAGDRMFWWLRPLCEDVGFKYHQTLTWCKTNIGGSPGKISGDWNYLSEIILLFHKGKRTKMLNEVGGIKTFNWFLAASPQTNFNENCRLHPAQFPEQVIRSIIARTPGGLILDPFLGSGTTAYCAKKLNRRCIGYEIEEKYCEIAANRCRQMVMEL